MVDETTWAKLHDEAVRMTALAYVPYSEYPVGAAALCDDGRVVSGCNVENAGYGVTLCAECGLISDFIKGGGGKLIAFTCVNKAGDTITPCGRCRQLLFEHGGHDLLLKMPTGIMTMDEVLPGAFGPADLDEIKE